jgi:nicotinamide riboside kinase
MKINIAFAGGPCTGKSTLAAALFAELKIKGFDYDLIGEVAKRIKKEYGNPRSPFERFFMWREQEKEELTSSALNGFITDTPLFHYYAQAKQYAFEARDKLAVTGLLDMCLEIKDRYQVIIVVRDQFEIFFKNDQTRTCDKEQAKVRHNLIVTYIQHFLPEKLFFIDGNMATRIEQIMKKLAEMNLS